MACGHVSRIKRPNTWLHRPMLQNVKKALANPEPSTHGTDAKSDRIKQCLSLEAKRKTSASAEYFVVCEQASKRLSRSLFFGCGGI